MLFSQHFGVQRDDDDDWFDPILNSDTHLFADPFLIFKEPSEGFWADAHTLLIQHFNRCFLLVAQGHCNPESVAYKKAVDLLCFREPRELCLGYTQRGTAGSGGGRGYAQRIASAIADAIERGVASTSHFEELGIIEEGIGADRISDIFCNILKSRLVEYTKAVALKYDLNTSPYSVWASDFDEQRLRWTACEHNLPTNPVTGGPILLIPKRFLRDLPQINYMDWWEWYESEQLRIDVNYEVLGAVDKKTIIDTARAHPQILQRYIGAKEAEPPEPYDLEADRHGVWVWHSATKAFVDENPNHFSPVHDEQSFNAFIERLLEIFRHFIEENGGWRLLWNEDGTEKRETAVQLLFRGIVEQYCKAENIVIDREVELGKGPVDFKFSQTYSRRALLEVKKLHNGKFWNGLERQLPSYLSSDEVSSGWFLAVQYKSNRSSLRRLQLLPGRVRSLQTQFPNLQIHHFTIDAMAKESASNL